MFSKTLFVALSLFTLTAPSVLCAKTCPAQSTSTVTVTASAGNVAAATSLASTAATATTSSTSKSQGRKGSSGSKSSKTTTTSAAASTTTTARVAAETSTKSSKKSKTKTSAAASTTTATSGTGNAAASDDEQSATTLASAVVATGFALDGQQTPADGQVASLTSTNNYINFCLTVNKAITNGQQIKAGSCNPAPMGVIAATTNMPSSKFVNPKNGGTLKANTAFTIQMAINNIETGNFVNAQSNYYSAPQQVNSVGNIIGHTHVVVEELTSLGQTTLTDPSKFAFFKGINGAAQNGVVTADVTDGLPAGFYRIASINAAANHQPVLVAVAQHGSLDDMAYFTVE